MTVTDGGDDDDGMRSYLTHCTALLFHSINPYWEVGGDESRELGEAVSYDVCSQGDDWSLVEDVFIVLISLCIHEGQACPRDP